MSSAPLAHAADLVAKPAADAPMAAFSASPDDAASGIFLVPPLGGSWGAAGIEMQAAGVTNARVGGTSGTLRMALWATPVAPLVGSTIFYYPLGPAWYLGVLIGGFHFNALDSGLLSPFTPPPNGCYFVSLALEEYTGSGYQYVDLATFNTNGVPDPGGSGFDRYAFGVPASACAAPPASCVPDSTTGCLLNGRFKTTVRYRNAFDDDLVDSTAFIKPVTGFASDVSETAFFYFGNQDNVEMMVKILDQGNVNPQGQQTIAVLFGSATPLRIELTVTDTESGAQHVYVSHEGAMSGGQDFTAFVRSPRTR
jgi:hypothetical protein